MRLLFDIDPAMCPCTGGLTLPEIDCDRCGGMGRLCSSCESAMGESEDAYCRACRALIETEERFVIEAEAELAFAFDHPPSEKQMDRALAALDRGDLRGLCDALHPEARA